MGVAGDPELTKLAEGSDAPILLGTIQADGNFGISEKKFDFRKVTDIATAVNDLFRTSGPMPIAADIRRVIFANVYKIPRSLLRGIVGYYSKCSPF